MWLPSLTDILALPELSSGEPEVAAGRAGLSNQVRWVHVSELGDIAHLLSGGELLLTTGIALETSPQSLVGYVESLAAAGVAALVVEAGRRFDRVPTSMAEAADRLGLPVILLRREVKFVRVTEEAHSFIIDSQLSELRASQEIHGTFTEMAIEGASTSDIVRQAALMAHRPVLLSSRGRQVLAFETGDIGAALVLSRWGEVSGDIPVSGRTRFLPGEPGWLVTSVGARGETWALLAMMEQEGQPSNRAYSILDRAAVGLALNHLVDRDRETLEMQAQRSFLSDLLTGGQTAAILQTRAEALGLRAESQEFIAGYVRLAQLTEDRASLPGEADTRDLAQRVSSAAREAGVSCLVAPLASGMVGVLTSIPAHGDAQARLTRLAGAIHQSVTSDGAPRVLITIGSAVGSLHEVRRSLREAEQVMESLRDPAPKPFYQLPDVRLRGLLHLLRDDARVEMFCERELGPLLAADRRSKGELMQALHAFLSQAGNKTSAAAQLGLSRPTLYARLARIESILGVDLNSVDSRLSLQVAMMAMAGARRGL
ncbi:MAG: PucR family transcriptional regulator [Candidatus Dormibacteria bacterium]